MKKLVKIVIILLVLTFAGAFIYKKDVLKIQNNTASIETSSKANLSFSVLGDVHGNTNKLNKAIHDLHNINPSMDAMVLNGDIVDQGINSQYDAVKECLNKNASLLPKKVIKNIGNHEFYEYGKGYNNNEKVNEFINRYLNFSEEKSVYHDTWINGYHFISLGTEAGNTKQLGSSKAYISEEQQKWLKEKLQENYNGKRPIFVFLHHHLVGGIKGWVGVQQSDEVYEILKEYPQVILFTSHTHLLLQSCNEILAQPFKIMHTGAVSFALELDSKGKVNRFDDSQGLYVEVQGNKTIIKGRDFKTKTWVSQN